MGKIEIPLVVVVHTNHANEIDDDVRRALAVLETTGATLLNQSVLLAGVNDTVSSLVELSESLFDAGVLPYYLHTLDRVAGAAHFEVAENEARMLMAAVRAALPGYLVPRLVQEVEGAPAKIGVDLWA
jgi:L-lysine 2,3-aminomutase